MADSAVAPPPGYTLETTAAPSGVTAPPGYTVEGQQPEQPGFVHRFLEGAGLPTEAPKPIQSFKDLALASIAPAVDMYHKAIAPVQHAENLVKAIKSGDGEAAAMHLGNFLDSFIPGTGNAMQLSQETGKDIETGNLPGVAGTATGLAARAALAKGATKIPGVSEEAAASEEGAGLAKQIIKGKDVAQEPAKAAVRTATGAAEDASLLEGNTSIVDKPIQNLFSKERAAYAKQDKIAGFDMRALQDKLENTQERISNLTDTEEDVAMEAKLEKSRTAIMDKISEAEGKLKQAGVDPEEAKGIYQQRKAGEDFKKAIVQHVSSDGESINVDGLIESAKKLRFNKYGDRLEQFMGADGANKFMANLEGAQKSGVHAMKMQQVAKWLGGIAGLGAAGAGIHAVRQVVQ